MYMLVVDGETLIAAVQPEYPPNRTSVWEVTQELSCKNSHFFDAGFLRKLNDPVNRVTVFLRNVVLLHRLFLQPGEFNPVFPLEQIPDGVVGERLDRDVGFVEIFQIISIQAGPEIHEAIFVGGSGVTGEENTLHGRELYRPALQVRAIYSSWSMDDLLKLFADYCGVLIILPTQPFSTVAGEHFVPEDQ
jgi:hypothetical protein